MSDLEQQLVWQLQARGLKPAREHRFHPTRRWRFDLAFPAQMVGVEVEGGVFVSGRHTRGAGFRADCEKYRQASILGWCVLRYTDTEVKSGLASEEIAQVVSQRVNGGVT